MGKAKSRILHKGRNDLIAKISRTDAITQTANLLNEKNITEASNLITLFGLSAEEVLEAGANYEAVTAIRNIFK